MPLRAIVATTVLAAAPLTGITGSAHATATRSMPPCNSSQTTHFSNGWSIKTPAVFDLNSGAYRCNLKLGDRYSDPEIYNGVLVLQRNLNSCYRTHLVVDGIYGPKTRDAVRRVQLLHHINADGIYGPQTRSAMVWRMANGSLGRVSERCYSPF